MNIIEDKSVENTELVERIEVENTPFTIVKIDGEYFGTMGEYRLTEKFNTLEECEEAVSKFSWNRVIQVMMLLVDKLKAVDLEELIKDKKEEE